MASGRDDPNYIPPRPWSVRIEEGEMWGIQDANGDRVVETDCGHYPPSKATAELIVTLVNNYYAGDKP